MHVPEQPYGSVYLPLVGMDLRFVSARDNGSLCIELNPTVGSTHFSLVGTPDELHWLCDKLRAIVTAHESQTTLAGEAAARVAANAHGGPYPRCQDCGCELGRVGPDSWQCDAPGCVDPRKLRVRS